MAQHFFEGDSVLALGKDAIIRAFLIGCVKSAVRGKPVAEIVCDRTGLSEVHADQLCLAYGINPDDEGGVTCIWSK